jgi:Ran GTPase-activating protein (RanGAP) involved in mRNA processing and transport
VKYLAAALSKMPQLIKLVIDISNNKIGNEGVASIAQALLTFTNLAHFTLKLDKNGITS